MRETLEERAGAKVPLHAGRMGLSPANSNLGVGRPCSYVIPGKDIEKQSIKGFSDQDVKSFTDTLLTHAEDTAIQEFLAYLESQGTPSHTFGMLLTAAAQDLGERWSRDSCSFAEVTLGMAVMHRLLHRYSGALAGDVPVVTGSPVVLVTPLPGEAHIFASALLAEHFRAGGWRVFSGVDAQLSSVVRRVKEHHVDVAAITVSSTDKIDETGKLIREIRGRSKNDVLHILVGGPPFVSDPDLHRSVGADATARDAMTALYVAGRFVSKSVVKD